MKELQDERQIAEIFETTEFLLKELQGKEPSDIVAIISMLNIVSSMVVVISRKNRGDGEHLKEAILEYLNDSWRA